MCADTGRRIENERRNVLFYGILQKQRFSSRSSFLPKCSTLYRVIIFRIIECKNRCVRIKVPHIRPDPGRHDIRLSPAAAETVSAPVLPLFASARNTIETLYQISLVKAFFLLYNTDTGEPRMQHPWRQREHPFFSDLIALILCFPNAQIHGCGPLRASICSMSSLSHGRFPLCLLCSFLRRSCPRTGAALFCLFGSTDGSARLSFSTQSFYVTCFFLC